MSIGLTAYMITVAILTPVSGWLADRFGGRNVFAASICVFTIASVLCGLCQDLTTFAACRVLQGIGGALMTSVGRLIVFRTTPKSQLVRAINWMTVPMLLGPTLGPPIGGFLTEYVSWRAGFFINVPIGLGGLIAVAMLFPKGELDRRRFDFTGFVLNGAAMVCLIYGLQSLATEEDKRVGIAMSAAAAPLVLLAWRHARTALHPLIDLQPLRHSTFRMTTLTGGNFMRVTVGVSGFFMPLIFQLALGMSPLTSGMLVLAHMAGDLSAKSVTTRAVRWLGFRKLLMISLACYAAGMMAFVLFDRSTSIVLMAILLFAAGAARSFQMTGITALQFADVPPQEMTAASTLSAVTQQGVRALSVALAALLLNAIAIVVGSDPKHLGLGDFHIAFALIAAFAALGLLWYRRLALDAGSAVSGR
jgi:EmrB/QacA subfamily drug resistance transporter